MANSRNCRSPLLKEQQKSARWMRIDAHVAPFRRIADDLKRCPERTSAVSSPPESDSSPRNPHFSGSFSQLEPSQVFCDRREAAAENRERFRKGISVVLMVRYKTPVKKNHLPQGIVHAKSDMELKPLWLSKNSGLKESGRSHENLLTIPAGIKQKKNVDSIVRKIGGGNGTSIFKFCMAVCLANYTGGDDNIHGWGMDLKLGYLCTYIVKYLKYTVSTLSTLLIFA
ncbi:hypothetical protein QJS10_CPA09g01433 [Acorus calamus]|uniref:Uncharacterized protein n=1 Tax=Acorus calamus TaxID=4465 RepID=A0AAV9E5X9_ACOCL|nr:hypothetical protein QJS10_CPA09g01433 [Acorus calamus]